MWDEPSGAPKMPKGSVGQRWGTKQGEWNLRGYSKLVGWTAIVWVVFVSIYFFSPFYPVLGYLRAHQYSLFVNNFN